MLTDKEIKKKYAAMFAKEPEKYFPTSMKPMGFTRKTCGSCRRFFWSVTERKVCGSPECSGGFSFIGNTPARARMDYIEVWKKFSGIMEKQGYTPVKRYPVPARWRDDLYFVEASIDNFIPYVINGIVEPPAKFIVIPQMCLRFGDIDSTGLTGAHYTCFVMIGQHTFQKPENYDFNAYLSHLMKWFTDGMKIPPEEIILHEDIWAGSGNFGNSLEFFSGGLELANQVYMQFRSTNSGYKDLPLKVLDMGLGHERNAWFSSGSGSSYETTFPTVMKELKSLTGIKEDKELMKSFLPYASYLNIDEVEDANKAWKRIAEKTGYDVEALKESVIPLSSLYSIAEHTRTLLVAITDGALPSNVGGGYNLRVILRRALSFIDRYGWDIDLAKLCELHASYLKPLFPELNGRLQEIAEILEAEKERYINTREKSVQIVSQAVQKNITEEKLIELYDSHGIDPQMIKEEAEKLGRKIAVPDNFYAKVSEQHRRIGKSERKEIDVEAIEPTRLIYYEDQSLQEFEAKVLRVIDGKYVILDKTCFYPRGGGQEPDHGWIGGCRVYDAEKINSVVAHLVENPSFREGDTVKGKIDWPRRVQLTQHHTATHIINGTAIKVLGRHVFQAGAYKGYEKAHIDITHYKNLTEEEIEKIESGANRIISEKLKVTKTWMKRNDAEQKYGFNIYQGGAVPGKEIRIVNIPEKDVEACGGTHLDNTKDAVKIIITRTERIQDGIVRIEYVAGRAAELEEEKHRKLVEECCQILGTGKDGLVAETEKLFEKWKSSRKERERTVKETAESAVEDIKNKMVNGVLVERVEGDARYLQEISRKLSGDSTLIILFGTGNRDIIAFGSAGKDRKEDVGRIIKEACEKLGGKGGGSKNLGQGIGSDTKKLDAVISELRRKFR